MKAKTTKLICGSNFAPIPVGTEFEIIHLSTLPHLKSNCKGLPIKFIWNDEFELITETPEVNIPPDKLTPIQIENWRKFMSLPEIIVADEEINNLRNNLQKRFNSKTI